MIKMLDHTPQEVNIIKESDLCAWHELTVDRTGEIYAWLGVHIVEDQAGIHAIFKRSIVGIFRQVEKDWKNLRWALKDYGVKSMVASNPNVQDKRWPKLIKKFGFPEPEMVWMATMEV